MRTFFKIILTLTILFSFFGITLAQTPSVTNVENSETVNGLKTELKELRREFNDYKVTQAKEDAKKELDYSERAMIYLERAERHSEKTINYFLYILGVIGLLGGILGIKTLGDIKKTSKEIAEDIAEKEIKEAKKKFDIRAQNMEKKYGIRFNSMHSEYESRFKKIENKLTKEGERIINQNKKIDKNFLHTKGYNYLLEKKYKEALECFSSIVKIDSKDANAHYNKACAHAQLNQKKKAITSLKKAIEIDKRYKKDAIADKDFDNIRKSKEFEKLVK